MNKKLTWLLAGASATLIAGAALAADAQAEAASDAARAAPRVERHVFVQRGPGPDGQVRVFRGRGGGPEDRAEHLKTMLQLKPNQEAALKAYLEAVKPDGDRMVTFEKRGEKTTLQRLDDMEKRMAEHQAVMKKRNNATRAFYAQLDASQKKVFDTMPLMNGAPGHMAMMMSPRAMRHMPAPPMPPMPPAPPEPRE